MSRDAYWKKNIPDHKKVDLFVDKWKMQEVQSVNTGEKLQEETQDGDHVINSVDCEKYLGQVLSSDGSNTKNIVNLTSKGTGMVHKITNILNHMPGGKHHFELAVIFCNSYFISSMLS